MSGLYQVDVGRFLRLTVLTHDSKLGII